MLESDLLGQGSKESPPLSAVEGGYLQNLVVPHAPHEAEPGHTYRLARSLQAPEPGRSELPDGTYLPVPDRVLDRLDELSGCAVRLCLLMVRASYTWADELGAFRATPRRQTARQLEEEEAGGLGMSRESLRRAAEELERRGWVECRRREGRATTYRWALKVPKKRFTLVPAPLFHAHQALSHSALTLLLSVIRATLGWARAEDGATTYRRAASLSASDLRGMTGLSRPTVRSAAEELEARSALSMRRKNGGSAWEYAVDFSFIRQHLHKSYAPSNRVENSNQHTHARETAPKDAPTREESRGQSGPKGSSYRVTEEWERDAIRQLRAEPVGMDPGAARDLVIRRARPVVEGALRAFRRRREDIDSPAGWLYSAIENLWFAPSIPNKSPDVRQSSGEAPIARALEALTERREGWEWEGEPSQEASGAGAGGADAGGTGDGVAEAEAVGVTHAEMTELIDALRQPPCDWETVDRSGRKPLFVPTPELGNWAWRRRETGSEEFREAARRVVRLRKRYEAENGPAGPAQAG